MKKKKSIYLLLPLVLIIWGALIYQFFSYVSPAEINAQNEQPLLVAIEYKEPDTTAIEVNYRDPFTGRLENQKQSNSKQIQTSKNYDVNLNISDEEQVRIEYKGIVTDAANKNKVFMVIINEQSFLMRQGDKEKEVLLIRGNDNYIIVKHRNKKEKFLIIE